MEIPDVSADNINIRKLEIPNIPDWLMTPPQAIPPAVPVTQQIGVPIVDMPGCVEAHETNNAKNNQVKSDDERGVQTYCDSGLPSFNPIQFEPEQVIPTPKQKPFEGINTGGLGDKPDPKVNPDLPKAAAPAPSSAKIDCPTASQQVKEPVGTYIEGFRKKVIEYKLINNECIQITEKVPIPEQIIAGAPSAGVVMTTASIAVVATASALMAKPLADVLLKVIKPTVKKVMKKISKLRGKKPKVLSLKDRQDQQRLYSHALRKLKGKE